MESFKTLQWCYSPRFCNAGRFQALETGFHIDVLQAFMLILSIQHETQGNVRDVLIQTMFLVNLSSLLKS